MKKFFHKKGAAIPNERAKNHGAPAFKYSEVRNVYSGRNDFSDQFDSEAYRWTELKLVMDDSEKYYLVMRTGIVHVMNTVGKYVGYVEIPKNMKDASTVELIAWWNENN